MTDTQKDYTCTITTPRSAADSYAAINNVADWWSRDMDGAALKVGDVFTVRFGETWVTSQVTAMTADSRVEWLVTDCYKHWLKDKKEWVGTSMIWEVVPHGAETQIRFTHIGLVPGIECYEGCEKGWNYFIKESILPLLTTGVGLPYMPKA